MFGTCGDCKVSMDPPLITVMLQLIDESTGEVESASGYYCKAACAKSQIVETLDLYGVDTSIVTEPNPLPIIVVDPVEFKPGHVINTAPGVSLSSQPKYNADTYIKASQLCADLVDSSFVFVSSNTLLADLQMSSNGWNITRSVEQTQTAKGFFLPYTKTTLKHECGFTLSFGYDDYRVRVEFEDSSLDIDIVPSNNALSDRMLNFLGEHISVALNNYLISHKKIPTGV